jgi:hypothetical protein
MSGNPHAGSRVHRESTFPPQYSELESTSANPTQLADPPTYFDIFGDPEEEVPAGAPPTQHDHVLQSGMLKNKPWVTMRILTRPSSTPHKVPRFYGGDDVAGTIDLKLDQPQTVNSIALLVSCSFCELVSIDLISCFCEAERKNSHKFCRRRLLFLPRILAQNLE